MTEQNAVLFSRLHWLSSLIHCIIHRQHSQFTVKLAVVDCPSGSNANHMLLGRGISPAFAIHVGDAFKQKILLRLHSGVAAHLQTFYRIVPLILLPRSQSAVLPLSLNQVPKHDPTLLSRTMTECYKILEPSYFFIYFFSAQHLSFFLLSHYWLVALCVFFFFLLLLHSDNSFVTG